MKDSTLFRVLLSIGKYSVLAVVLIFTLGPFAWLVVSSFKPAEEIFRQIPTWYSENFTLANYRWALGPLGANIGRFLSNAFAASAGTALLSLLFAAIGGYSLARYQFPGYKAVSVVLLLAQMFQGPLIMVPWYKMAAALGILNTKLVLALIYGTTTIPVSVWLMSGFYRHVPRTLEEAALVDGCSRLGALWRIIVPSAAPGLVATTLFAFVTAWNDYQYALILTSSDKAKTIQVGISELVGFMGMSNWGGIMASGVLATIPIIFIFAYIQKYLIEGLTAGAVKG